MYKLCKRLFDIVVSLVVVIILSPLFIVLFILLKCTGEGYIFYYQKRIGYKNRYFNIIKFATMLKNSPNMGTGVITLRNDPRVTPVGKYLRISKINELPQVFNVLKGDMSIVGPRPIVDKTFEAYSPEVQKIVYESKPGITGIGSIIFRDEEAAVSASSNPVEFYKNSIAPYKGELETWYYKNRSFWVDICIVFLTVWVILFPTSKLPYRMFPSLPKRTESYPVSGNSAVQ